MMAAAEQNSGRPKAPISAPVGGQSRQAGDWIEGERRLGRPKARLFLTLSLLWIFPSLGAGFILAAGAGRWFEAAGLLAGIRSVLFEEWIALALLLAHTFIAGLAWHFRRTEPLREEVFLERNPDDDGSGVY